MIRCMRLFDFAFVPNYPEPLDRLKALAANEHWGKGGRMLRSYFNHMFDKVIEDTAVPKFKQGVIISLPFLKFIAFKANSKADDPELTIKPNFLENNFEILFSKELTDLPIWVEFFKVFKTAFISSES